MCYDLGPARALGPLRVIEAEVRKRLQPESTEPKDERRTLIIEELEQRLRRNLGVQVRLKTGSKPNGPGKIEVPYSDLDELNRLLQTLLGPAES